MASIGDVVNIAQGIFGTQGSSNQSGSGKNAFRNKGITAGGSASTDHSRTSGKNVSNQSTNTKGSQNTTNTGTSATTGTTANNSASTGSTASNSASTGSTTNNSTTGTSSLTGSNSTSTTVGTANQGALDKANLITNQALKDSTDQGKINSLVNSTLSQASIAFAPTLAQGVASGGYNSTSTNLLSSFAKAQATADATQSVLQYQQGEQGIANQSNATVIDATKGATTTGGTSTTNTGTSTNTGTANSSSNTANTGTSNSNTNDTGTNTSNTSNANTSDTTNQSTTNQTDLQKFFSNNQDNISKLFETASQDIGKGQQSSTASGSSSGGGLLDTIICTELVMQGKLDGELMYNSSAHFYSTHSKFAFDSYIALARPIVEHIRNYPSGWLCKIMQILFTGRCKYVMHIVRPKRQRYSISNHCAYMVVYTTVVIYGYTVFGPTQLLKNKMEIYFG